MAGTYLVKKYANRKLYDTVTRRYVTLDVVGELVVNGTDVRVVDQASGDDITAATLAQLSGAPRASGTARAAAVRRPSRPRRAPSVGVSPATGSVRESVKGRGEQLVGVLRASLALPTSLAQGAVGELGQRASLDTVFGRRRQAGNSHAAEIASLRARVEDLIVEVERLHGELAELRPVRNGVAR